MQKTIPITGCSNGNDGALARECRNSGHRGVDAALPGSPPPRGIRAGTNSVRLPLLKTLLPANVFDARMSQVFGLDRLRG